MAIGPITFLEIQAFSRLMLVELSAWEVGLIRRLDEAVLAVLDEKAPRTAGKAPPAGVAIPVADTAGIRALMQGMAAKKAAQTQSKAPPAPRQRRIIQTPST